MTATATSPLDGLAIHHDSEVGLTAGSEFEGCDELLHDVLLDGKLVGRLRCDDAEHLAVAIERRIKHARLVRGIRQMADFIEQRPDLPVHRVVANVDLSGADVQDRLRAVAEQIGEYETEVFESHVLLRRDLEPNIRVEVFAYNGAAAVYQLPELPGRNLAAEPEAAAA